VMRTLLHMRVCGSFRCTHEFYGAASALLLLQTLSIFWEACPS
jgi:hypothetical protein